MNDNKDQNIRISDSIIDEIKNFVLFTKFLVNNPEEVDVDVQQYGYTVVVILKTNPRDVGQVIGRSAHIIMSIRSILAAIAGKNGIRILFDYVTEKDNKRKTNSDNNRY